MVDKGIIMVNTKVSMVNNLRKCIKIGALRLYYHAFVSNYFLLEIETKLYGRSIKRKMAFNFEKLKAKYSKISMKNTNVIIL